MIESIHSLSYTIFSNQVNMIEQKEYFKDNYAKIDLTKKVLSDLKDYEKNNKIHPEIQKSTLKDIIAEVWYDVPIVIDKHDVIVAWHCRKEALTLLWVIYVDVIVKDTLSEKQIREYRLLDNKIAELAEDHIENINFELEELDIPRLNELYNNELEDIDFDNITSNEDRSMSDKTREIECPDCWNTFSI